MCVCVKGGGVPFIDSGVYGTTVTPAAWQAKHKKYSIVYINGEKKGRKGGVTTA